MNIKRKTKKKKPTKKKKKDKKQKEKKEGNRKGNLFRSLPGRLENCSIVFLVIVVFVISISRWHLIEIWIGWIQMSHRALFLR